MWVCPACIGAQVSPRLEVDPPSARYEGEFTGITAVREFGDGTLLVADRGGWRLRRIDTPRSRPILVATSGAPSGQYSAIRSLFPLGTDSTLAVEAGLGGTLLIRGGRVVERFRDARLAGGQVVGANAAGEILLRRRFTRQLTKGGDTTLLLDSALVVRLRRNTRAVDSVARLDLGVSRSVHGNGEFYQLLLSPVRTEDQAYLFPDGTIAIAHARAYRIVWHASNRRSGSAVRMPFERVTVDTLDGRFESDRRARLTGEATPRTGGAESSDSVPAFLRDALLGDWLGRLVVRRRSTVGAPNAYYDVIEQSAGRLGQAVLPSNQAIVGFGRSSVYIAVAGDHETQVLQRHPWPPAGLRAAPSR